MESDNITIGGICSACKRYSPGLFTCHSCGSRVCPNCIVPGTSFCVLCKGRKMIK